MDPEERRSWRGLPISEVTYALAVILGLIALFAATGSQRVWAATGAVVLGLIAGVEISWRTTNRRR